jgi:hypothetical protein
VPSHFSAAAVNGANSATGYTGAEFHLEGAIQKALTPAFAVGARAFYYNQITGDSGFRRQAGTVARPARRLASTLDAPAARHVGSGRRKSRLQGHMIWLDLTLPLIMRPPPGAPHP